MESSLRTEGDMFEERAKALFRVLQATKIVKQDHLPCKIEEGLYVGSLGAANNKSALQSLNVTHILTVANLLSPAHPNDFTHHNIQVSDRVDVPISKYFDECFAFIEEARRTGGGVLVHCFAGKSRSVTVVIAYLMFKNGVGLSEAFDHVKSVRPVASPNRGFMSQLQEFEQSLQAEMVSNAETQIAARIRAQDERRQRRMAAPSRGEAGPSRPAKSKRRRIAARRASPPKARRVPAVEVYSTVVVDDSDTPMTHTEGCPTVTVGIPRVESPRRAPESTPPPSLFEHSPGEFSLTLGRKVSLLGDQNLLRGWDKNQIETQLHHCGLQTLALATYIGKSFTNYEDTIESLMQQIQKNEETIQRLTSEMNSMKLSYENSLQSEREQREQVEKSKRDLEARFNREINQISSEYLNRGREEGRQLFLQSLEFQEMQHKALQDFQASTQFQDVVLEKSAKFMRTGFYRCQAQCMLNPEFSAHTDWSFLDASRRVDLEGVTCDDKEDDNDSIVDITEDQEELPDDVTQGDEAEENT